jgi:hypothetical protein
MRRHNPGRCRVEMALISELARCVSRPLEPSGSPYLRRDLSLREVSLRAWCVSADGTTDAHAPAQIALVGRHDFLPYFRLPGFDPAVLADHRKAVGLTTAGGEPVIEQAEFVTTSRSYVRRPLSTARAVISGLLTSMERSYPSVDTDNAQSMYVPAGIALEKRYEACWYRNHGTHR